MLRHEQNIDAIIGIHTSSKCARPIPWKDLIISCMVHQVRKLKISQPEKSPKLDDFISHNS